MAFIFNLTEFTVSSILPGVNFNFKWTGVLKTKNLYLLFS